MSQDVQTIRISEHVRLDKRARSSKWQARVKLADGSWHRFSTKTESVERATDLAMKFFYTAEDRAKNNLPQSTRKFNHNAAFERFESDLFFIVNPDIILNENLDLDLIVEQLIRDRFDISSPQIVGVSGAVEDYKRADLTFPNLLKRKFFRKNVEKFDWLAGMFLIVNSTSFRKLQGFDTDFFMYVEDCDLSMRARKAGMKIGDIGGFSVVHDARRASTKSFKHFRWHITSLLRYWFLK